MDCGESDDFAVTALLILTHKGQTVYPPLQFVNSIIRSLLVQRILILLDAQTNQHAGRVGQTDEIYRM